MKKWEIEQRDRIRELMTEAKASGQDYKHLENEAIKLDKRLRRGKANRQPAISYC